MQLWGEKEVTRGVLGLGRMGPLTIVFQTIEICFPRESIMFWFRKKEVTNTTEVLQTLTVHQSHKIASETIIQAWGRGQKVLELSRTVLLMEQSETVFMVPVILPISWLSLPKYTLLPSFLCRKDGVGARNENNNNTGTGQM